jgi:hypothetical protein
MSRGKPQKFRGQFVMLPMAFLQSPAFRWKLPGGALRLLCELMARFNGRNNGKLFCSYREAQSLLGLSQEAYDKGVSTLKGRGIAVCTSPGKLAAKKAAEWRLTFLADAGELPTNEYMLWQPPSYRKPIQGCIGNQYRHPRNDIGNQYRRPSRVISETDTHLDFSTRAAGVLK